MNRHNLDRRLRSLETRASAARLVITLPPETYPEELPSIAELIVYGSTQAAEHCTDPGEEYILVGIGRWRRLPGGELVSTIYAEQ